MLVKMLADGETYNGHYKEGDVKDLNMSVAQALIKQGKAEEYTPTPKERETLDNREGRKMEMQRTGVGATAQERNLTPAQRTLQAAGAREPNETLARMQTGEGAEVDDDSETGAKTKAFEAAQMNIATQEGAEEESTRDLNEEAKDAAAKDAEAARDETKNRTEETKSDTKPTSGTRTSRP
jgi:hypothetical protein